MRLKSPVRISEKQFMAQVRELAGWCGWKVYHTHDSRRSTPGFPDLCLVRPPRVIFAELKIPGNNLTDEQRAWRDALVECFGVETYVWYPYDWDTIERELSLPQ